MSEHIRFDRKKGFVALPVEICDLDLSPGAFRLLVELCRMANMDGYCWPSLAQLSERLGRSKAAISSYLKDLRAQDLIETQEQKTANGYNYRLKYKVTFWAEWRGSVSTKHATKTERSVQPDERISKDKNQSDKKQVKAEIDSETICLVSNWSKCFKGAPYPLAACRPSRNLIKETKQFLTKVTPFDQDISADIKAILAATWSELNISTDPSSIESQADILRTAGFRTRELSPLKESLLQSWPDHWRKVPSEKQFKQLLAKSGIAPASQQRKVLAGYLRRWEMAEKHLPKSKQSDLLPRSSAADQQVAA